MRLAFTIGAYRLVDFIKLGVKQIQKLAPDSPILISDDPSPESEHIRRLAQETGCTYKGARVRRGHFASDFQSLVNCLAFATAAEADVAVKVSQRFIFRKQESIDVIQKTFEDLNILMATPGQPVVTNGGRAQKGFSAFTILTDVVMFRVGAITPEELLVMYRSRILRETVPWKDFIETAIDELHAQKFSGRTVKIPELTNPTGDPIFLRRYQATEEQYRNLALSHGTNGNYPLVEWSQIEQRNYICKPLVI